MDGWTCIDALSEVEYSKEGLIKNAVVPHYRSEDFYKENINNIWIYYCCTHQDYYSNRFFAYPLWRTGIMGIQDMSVLELLTSLIGKEKVTELIDDVAGIDVTFSD